MSTIATGHSEAFPGGDRAPVLQLVVVDGVDAGRALLLDATAKTVGADAGCELVLADDRVSRKHLRVTLLPEGVLVEDLGSRNGTLYEGNRITRAVLRPGATLRLGHSYLRLLPVPRALALPPSNARRFGEVVGESLAMRELFAVLERVSESNVTVLLEGETGVGKELVARAIHDASNARKGPFIAVDCAALPESLVESELFGHVRGAFTGATDARKGAFLRAHGGTLFLDELGSVPMPVQARLLRVLEERLVRAVGADEERKVDVRVIAASREDLSRRVAEGHFKPDLYYRLSVVRVVVPPLRARREDIGPIAAELLRRRGVQMDPSGDALARLSAHDWPGNVRELRNILERALALNPGARHFEELFIELGPSGANVSEGLSIHTELPYGAARQAVLDAFERGYIAALLLRHKGNLSAAARAAEMDRKYLRALADKHGLLPNNANKK